MPCDYRILQSPTKGQVKLVLLETAQRSPLSGHRSNSKKGLHQIDFDTDHFLCRT